MMVHLRAKKKKKVSLIVDRRNFNYWRPLSGSTSQRRWWCIRVVAGTATAPQAPWVASHLAAPLCRRIALRCLLDRFSNLKRQIMTHPSCRCKAAMGRKVWGQGVPAAVAGPRFSIIPDHLAGHRAKHLMSLNRRGCHLFRTSICTCRISWRRSIVTFHIQRGEALSTTTRLESPTWLRI